MSSDRSAAVSAGVLFIVATAASIWGSVLAQPVLDDPDRLTKLSASAAQVTEGALLSIIAALASVGIAVAMYPVVQRSGPGLAIGSVVFRSIEAVMYTLGAVGVLSLLALSGRFTTAPAADRGSLQLIAEALLALRERTLLAGVIAFALGALLYYWVFYRARLIPRWLSGWGIAAIVLAFAASLLAMFSQSPVTTYAIILVPIAVQEMVLAVWLIAKGFSPSSQR